jgi:hypothetical protein
LIFSATKHGSKKKWNKLIVCVCVREREKDRERERLLETRVCLVLARDRERDKQRERGVECGMCTTGFCCRYNCAGGFFLLILWVKFDLDLESFKLFHFGA